MKRAMVILFLLILALISMSGVFASDVNDDAVASVDNAEIELTATENDVKATEDDNGEILSAGNNESVGVQEDLKVLGDNPGTYSELRSEIGHGGDITLTHDYYTFDEGHTIEIDVDNSVIDGNGATIDMAGSNIRAFEVSASGVTIKNLTIKNVNYAEYDAGGAIYFFKDANVINCNFSKNKALHGSGGVIRFVEDANVINCNFTDNSADSMAGAVYFGGYANVINCTFVNNYATNSGGAILMLSGNVENCTFVDNRVEFEYHGNGGAIWMNSGTVRDCNFTDNRASSGGAVYIYHDGTVENSNFTNNHASSKGGAIYFEELNTGSVINCNFDNNKVTASNEGYGGAIYFGKDKFGSVINCNFNNNLLTGDQSHGGAIYMCSGSVENCNFTNNNVSYVGGAIYFYKIVNVKNCNFINNKATDANGRGGAIFFISDLNEVTIINCNFTNNTANYGGAVFSGKYSNGTVENCNFTNNRANIGGGGAIYFEEQSTGNVKDCNFADNNASVSGGAIYFNDKSAGEVTNCNFTNNQATENGGAVFISNSGSTHNITNCNFIKNSATHGGGAVWIYSGSVVNCNFTDNYAYSGNGGAVYFWNNGNVENCNFINDYAGDYMTDQAGNGGAVYFKEQGSATYCNFTGNRAYSGDGGALYFEKQGSATYCNFADNAASKGGAVLFMQTSTITNCNFRYNKANYGVGGAIYFDESAAGNVVSCNFSNNWASQSGAAVYFKNDGEVTDCSFNDNDARYGGGALYFDDNGDVRDCNFNDNEAGAYNGGAVWIKSGSVANCNFTDNEAISTNGGALYIWSDVELTSCNFNHNVASDGGAFFVMGTCTIRDCNFTNNQAISNNGGAICFDQEAMGTVLNCNFANNQASHDGGAVYFYKNGEVKNSNFTNNKATSGNGGAVYFFSNGGVENCNFTLNQAKFWGGAVCFYGMGATGDCSVSNCNFVSNKATDVNSRGGSIYACPSCSVENSNFTHNQAQSQGGAVYFLQNGNVGNCNFKGNNATSGSAIYFDDSGSTTKQVSNSCLLNNRANADVLEVTPSENSLEIIFKGHDNLINAIYSPSNVDFTNVTYWGANGITNTDDNYPSRSNKEAGQNITVGAVVNDLIVLNDVKVTDAEGKIVIENLNIEGNYFITVRHDADSYYTEAEVILKNMQFYVNVTEITTTNLAVNLTARSNIYNEVMPGKLQFVLSNGDKINATYAAGGIWWALHTFDDYGDYEVNASYDGLDNVVIKNATVSITGANSTIELDDVTLDYGDSINLTVKTEGATAITAKINDENVTVIDNFTILISGLDAGNYTLSVTTIPDDDHVSVTKTANITVNKVNSTLTLGNIVFDYNSSGSTEVSFSGAIGINASVIDHDEAIVNVSGNTITVSGLDAGNYTLAVTAIGDDNHNNVTKTANITVNKAASEISIISETLDLKINDVVEDVANLTPEGAGNLTFVSSDKNIVLAYDNMIFARSIGTATVTISFGGNKNYAAAESKTILVNVTLKDASISVENDTVDLNVDDGYEIDAVANPDILAIHYASSNESVATVSAHGIVKAIGMGSAIITLTVGDGETYAFNSTNVTVNVCKIATEINADDVEMDFKDKSKIIYELTPQDAIGNVTFASDNPNVVMVDDYGNLTALSAGSANVTITFNGNEKYEKSSKTVKVTVNKIATPMTFDVIVDGNDVTVNVTFDKDARGLVEFNIGSKKYYAPVNEGRAVLTAYFPVGRYMGNIQYSGDANFNESTALLYFTVSEPVKMNTTISCDVDVDGNNVTVSAGVDLNATGFVEFVIGDSVVYVPVNDGEAVYDVVLAGGNYTVVVTYMGDDRFNANSTSRDFTVSDPVKMNTTIGCDVSVDGDEVTVIANVDLNASGFVEFVIAGKKYYAPVVDGQAVLDSYFPAGTYSGNVNYLGDDVFNPAGTLVYFSVIEHNASLDNTSIDVSVGIMGNDVSIIAVVNESASGLVEFVIGDGVVYVPVNNGEAVYDVVLAGGDYTVVVTYMGDDRFNANSTSVDFTVTGPVKLNTTIGCDVSVDGDEVTVIANVDLNASGFVEFVIAGKKYYAPVVGGQAVLDSYFPAGTYSGNVNYLGDGVFNPASTLVYFTVIEQNTTLENTSIDVSVDVMGNDVSIIAVVNESASGLVEFVIGDSVVYVPVNNGEAVYDVVLAGGDYTVVVTYMGDDRFNANSTSKDFTVTDPVKMNTTIRCDVSVDEDEVTVIANVDLNATGLVEFVIAGKKYYALVVGGNAVLDSYFPAGTYSGNVNYLGDDVFNPAGTLVYFSVIEHNASLDNTSIDVSVDVAGNNVSVVAVVNESASGLVEFVIGDSVVYVPVNNGEAVYDVVLAGGDYTVVVTYMGDDRFNANSTSRDFTVTDPVKLNTTIRCDVSVVDDEVTLVAVVNESASGLVEFVIAGKKYYALVVGGNAVLDSYFPAGTYSGNVNYLGDVQFNPAGTLVYFSVIEHNASLDNTSIDVSVDVAGNNVSVVAVVNESASGLVEFVIGDSVVYVPVNNGEAVYDVVLAGGDYTVVVTYMGDDKFNANSTSNDFTVTNPVKLNTTIKCDVGVDGNEVTVIANVDLNASGLVEFVIAGKKYYAPVNDGQAIFVSDFLEGTYSGNVNYLGDELFNPAGTLVYFSVIEKNATLDNTSIDVDVSVDENNVTISAGINPAATGFVQFDIDDNVVYIAVNNGNATYNLVLPAGEYEVVATYLGDSKFNSNATSKSFEVTDKPVIVPIASEFGDIVISDDLSISVVLKDANGNPIANAPIKYSINGSANNVTTDNEGKFTIKAQNGDEITISYDGNATIIGTTTTLKLNASAPPTVIKLATRFAIDLNPSVTSITIKGYAVDTKAGEEGIYYSTVLLDENGNPMANVSMNFAVNNKIYNRTTYENGSFRPYQLDMIRAGRYTMALYYAGDETHNATLACVCFDLDKKPITIKASAKTYKATTKTKKYTITLKTIVGSSHDGKTHLRSGLKVTLKVNGKTFTAKTNSNGKATFKITNLKKKGKYVAEIYYKGDKTYEEATKSVKLTIK